MGEFRDFINEENKRYERWRKDKGSSPILAKFNVSGIPVEIHNNSHKNWWGDVSKLVDYCTEVVQSAVSALMSFGTRKSKFARMPIFFIVGSPLYPESDPETAYAGAWAGDSWAPSVEIPLYPHSLFPRTEVEKQKSEFKKQQVLHELAHLVHYNLSAEQKRQIDDLYYDNIDIFGRDRPWGGGGYGRKNAMEWFADMVSRVMTGEGYDKRERRAVKELKKILASPDRSHNPHQFAFSLDSAQSAWATDDEEKTLKARGNKEALEKYRHEKYELAKKRLEDLDKQLDLLRSLPDSPEVRRAYWRVDGDKQAILARIKQYDAVFNVPSS